MSSITFNEDPGTSQGSLRSSGQVTNKLLSGLSGASGSRSAPLEEEVKGLLTFESCPELLRGSSLHSILRRGGRIFVNSAGSAVTYKLSEQVDRLDAFFSHNWSCPRIHKVGALMLHFNTGPAFLGTLAWIGLILILSLLGWSPHVYVYDGTETTGVIGYLTPLPIFWILWFGMRELRSCRAYPFVFLDKTCIHQEDKEIQKLGIKKLGAFLSNADSVVVCYSPTYLRKLWTIYEAATFLCLKRVEDLHVIPFQLPWVVFAQTIVMMGFNICSFTLRITTPLRSLELILSPPFAFFYATTCRRMARAKAEISSTLENFTVDSCQCFDERDRPVVYRNIAVLMHARFKLPQGTTQEDALASFEQLVRTLLPTAFRKSLGRGNVHYKYAVMASFLTCFPRVLDHLSCTVNDGYSWRYYIHSWLCMHICLSFWIAPTGFVVVDRVASLRLSWTGRWDWVWICFSTFCGWMSLLVCFTPAFWFFRATYDREPSQPWDEAGDRSFAIFITYTVVGTSTSVIILSGMWRSISRFFTGGSDADKKDAAEVSEALEEARRTIAREVPDRDSLRISQHLKDMSIPEDEELVLFPTAAQGWSDDVCFEGPGYNVRL